MSKIICIVAGDPNSINSELIFKSWKKLHYKIRKKMVLIGNYELIKEQKRKLNFQINLEQIEKISENNNSNLLKIINVPLKFNDCFNVQRKQASRYVVKSLNLAHDLCQKKEIPGFINCPIEKILIKKRGIHGVTEFLGKKKLSNNFSEVMLLHNKKLSVTPITTHIKIKDISRNLKKSVVINKIKTIVVYYKKLFKKKPYVAVLGLNPHNSELDKNSEEVKIIIPAIKKLRSYCKIEGPKIADNFFKNEYKKYNVIVGMYHDQVLIPFKNFFRYDAINITLGLNYIRVSPDHGTAKDIIFKNKGNTKSLIECIKFINKLR